MASVSSPGRFRSARLKVQRANRHIDELNTELSNIDIRRFYEIRVHGYESGPTVVLLNPTKPVPDSLSCIVGDIVHNLKSALDHIFTEIVGDSVEKWDRVFPFAKSRPKNIAAGSRLDAVEVALPGSQRVILEEVQPYKGGRDNLYGLHELNIIDKHNELIIAATGAVLGKLVLLANGRAFATFNECTFNAEEPTVLYQGPDHVTIEHDFEATLSIRFGKALPFESEAVVPTLVGLSKRVSDVIGLFSALYSSADAISANSHEAESGSW